MIDKYETCPLAAAGFKLASFTELPTMVIGPDGKCICTVSDRCLDVDKRDGQRCTMEQLRSLDQQAISRRASQSGDGWKGEW